MDSPSKLVVLAGGAHGRLAESLAHELDLELGAYGAQRFPDGEMYVEVGAETRGRHVVLVQTGAEPAAEHLLELLLLTDACRRAGASAVSAVIPYLPYARQDHRTRPGESLAMRVVGDLLGRAGFERVYAVDLHSSTVEGFIGAPVEHLSAAPLLAQSLRKHAGKGAVIVAPDLGAAKLAGEYARILELPMAIVHKTRQSPREVAVVKVFGHVRGLRPIVVDDMITTGGTVAATLKALDAEGAAGDATVAATHALMVDEAVERLERAGVRRLLVTDTLPFTRPLPFPMEVVSVSRLLADAIQRATGGAK
ncbi:MAG TPA: ribose-phosphate pyrophosphokinase [Polyangiaceae bacterium]|nr:ribose-phosphate pyrophosphokinase [Polyangiaceae bacterium]